MACHLLQNLEQQVSTPNIIILAAFFGSRQTGQYCRLIFEHYKKLKQKLEKNLAKSQRGPKTANFS